jgi:hypothetical protein
MTSRSRQWAVLGLVVLAYFILFPGDLSAVLNPAEKLLALSGAVSPWLYVLLGVALLCWTALRICGSRPAGRDVPPR